MTNRSKTAIVFFTAALVTALVAPCTTAFAQDKPDALKLYTEGKYAEAEKVCLVELKETPKNMNSYSVLCWSLLAQEKYKDAAMYAEKGIKVSRYDRRVIESAARAYFHLGENARSLAYFEEFAQIAPTTNDIKVTYYLMGEIFIRLGEFNNADIAFSTALHYDNKQALWWARLGYARQMAKDSKYAIVAYENALRLNPALAEAQQGLKTLQGSSPE